MINNKEIQNNQRVNMNNLEKRLNEALSPACRQAGPLGWGWIAMKKRLFKFLFFLLISGFSINSFAQNRTVS